MTDDDLKRNQLAQNMRFYGDMRFKQLTLFMGAMTLLGAGAVQYPSATLFGSYGVRGVLALAGMLFTGVMWVMEIRSTLAFYAARAQASDLWPRVGQKWLGLTATNAVLFLHFAFYWFWFWCAAHWNVRCVALSVSGVLGVILVVFSVKSYWPSWTYKDS